MVSSSQVRPLVIICHSQPFPDHFFTTSSSGTQDSCRIEIDDYPNNACLFTYSHLLLLVGLETLLSPMQAPSAVLQMSSFCFCGSHTLYLVHASTSPFHRTSKSLSRIVERILGSSSKTSDLSFKPRSLANSFWLWYSVLQFSNSPSLRSSYPAHFPFTLSLKLLRTSRASAFIHQLP